MSDKKDLYEDRYVLDDYDTPSFYGKSADKYFGDIDREQNENRRDGVSDVNTLYEPTDYLKRRGMSRLEMEYYAGAAGINNVSGKDDLEAVYKAYVDDKAGGRNQKSIDSLRDDFNEFKNQQPEENTGAKEEEKKPYTDSPKLAQAKERAQKYQETQSKIGDSLLGNIKTKGFYVDTEQPNVTTESTTFTAEEADPDKQEYGQLIFS